MRHTPCNLVTRFPDRRAPYRPRHDACYDTLRPVNSFTSRFLSIFWLPSAWLADRESRRGWLDSRDHHHRSHDLRTHASARPTSWACGPIEATPDPRRPGWLASIKGASAGNRVCGLSPAWVGRSVLHSRSGWELREGLAVSGPHLAFESDWSRLVETLAPDPEATLVASGRRSDPLPRHQ